MNEVSKMLFDVPVAIWIAIASLVVSIAALVISNRRRSFEQRLLGEKKATELRSLYLQYLKNIAEFRRSIEPYEKMCLDCEQYPENHFKDYKEAADSFEGEAQEVLKTLSERASEETAIQLERITAYSENINKEVMSLTKRFQEIAHECPSKQRKLSNEPVVSVDAEKTRPK